MISNRQAGSVLMSYLPQSLPPVEAVVCDNGAIPEVTP